MIKVQEEKLEKTLPGLKRNISLKNHTTFRIGGPAKYFFEAKNKKDLIKAINAAKKYTLPFFILGGGSNLLVADQGYDGLVVKIKNTAVRIKKNRIFADAGLNLNQVVNFAAKNNLTGIGWASGIPGTVGGAVYGNAGAFSGSMADAIKEVEALDVRSNKIKIFKQKECEFNYRTSVFKKKSNLIIISCELRLLAGDEQGIKEAIKKNLIYRRERHPKEPSAGSVFKNVKIKNIDQIFFKKFPEAEKFIKENVLPSAYLIDQCGLKGKIIGGAMVSNKHPNFIVNFKNAKAKDVLKLINFVREKVRKKFGIELEEEIRFLSF